MIEVVNLSDTGRKRPHNEDSAITVPSLGLAIVADGMGGYKAGEVASAIAVKAIFDIVKQGLDDLSATAASAKAAGVTTHSLLLYNAVQFANGHIFRTARDVPQCQGMGTTVVAALFLNNTLTVAHVGDSRLYRFRDKELKQLTSDHSLVQELIDRGFFTPEEAAANTPKNLVTRALGIDEVVEPDVKEYQTETNDVYLICSDGLNDMVNDEEIRLTLSKYYANLPEAGRELIQMANANGGKDNISVVLIRPRTDAQTGGSWVSRLKSSFRRTG
ncbi:MAG: Stp1/IreP family PP2C-type Ser/Thr phosphatase [Gammaproteobacteria bacterium]|nr:Stp1/IreP family PP2C-type Ser/Thr phosphatase [Gammaproteobacteria bacterium]